ncbi:MAG: sulfurtransferase TusA family protein [Fibromonadaceae bacterium]|jgi:TusA-related sulfurtransferase|nr:sulfurtransferase TusA family protein [Fibromonadaceae bacterium]
MKLDITAEECPMTFVKTKVVLHEMKKGDILEVLLCGEEPLRNVPAALEKEGHKILSIEPLGKETHRIVIERG